MNQPRRKEIVFVAQPRLPFLPVYVELNGLAASRSRGRRIHLRMEQIDRSMKSVFRSQSREFSFNVAMFSILCYM